MSIGIALLLTSAVMPLAANAEPRPLPPRGPLPKPPPPTKPEKKFRDSKPRVYFQDARGHADEVVIHEPSGNIMIRSAPLETCLGVAYEVAPDRIVFAPDFDFDRKRRFEAFIRPKDRSVASARAELRQVLEKRFDLRLREESREMDVFLLRPYRDQLRLQPAEPSDAPATFEVKRGELRATRSPISRLVADIARRVERPILDESKLEDRYDFFIQWDPRTGAYGFLQALQDLGLTLEPETRTIDVWVVESRSTSTESASGADAAIDG